MRILLPALVAIASTVPGDIGSDLAEVGVPVSSVELTDSMLVVEMSGCLSRGDSLLKHYGGVFYTAVDSILAGWDVVGIAVRIDQATLVFGRDDMFRMFDWISDATGEEAIAEWVLNNTRVIREEDLSPP
ncbi:MAG: hypothetical protein R6U39_06675 [Candidatus Aegiribacteria sp.]